MVALLIEHPVPAQCVWLRRLRREFATRFIALFLRMDVITRIAMECNLRDYGCITFVVECFCVVLGLDPYLRQSVAKLDIIARLSALRTIGLHIAAFRLHQRIGLRTALTHHSPQPCDRSVIGSVKCLGSIFLTDTDPASLAAHLHVPAQCAQRRIVEIEIHSRIPSCAGIAFSWPKHWFLRKTNAWSLAMR